jgi:hypothetical protein
MSSAVPDEFIAVHKNSWVKFNMPPPYEAIQQAAYSFATPEMMAFYEKEKKENEEYDAKQAKEKAEQERTQKEKAQQAENDEKARRRREAADRLELKGLYQTWKRTCDPYFEKNSTVVIVVFPYLPKNATKCTEQSCIIQKVAAGSIMACRHDVEKLYRASGNYSITFLKQERLNWHPDKVGRRSDPQKRKDFEKLATQFCQIIQELIDEGQES